jgi:hypothetical protein
VNHPAIDLPATNNNTIQAIRIKDQRNEGVTGKGE